MIAAMVSGYGSRIKLRRQALGMTQAQLAERVGVHVSAVLAWEKERYFPSRYQGAVEAVLGISLSGDQAEDTYTDPDEAALWSLDRYTEAERRAFIEALRARRRERAG